MREASSSIPHIVLDAVCRKFGVARMDVLGDSRARTRTLARQVVYYILREEFDYSFPEIGMAMNRDHTTAMSSIPKMKQRLEEDEEFKASVDEAIAEIHKLHRAVKKTEVVCAGFSPVVHKRLQQLLETGLYGSDLGDVVERLVCQQLQGLKVTK
jgi:hypothetical protein